MKLISLVFYVGILMVIVGLVINFAVDPQITELTGLRAGGTFTGLMGIGVAIAGFLMFIVNRPQKTDLDNFDV